jgi:predicted ATP-dependent serine protease
MSYTKFCPECGVEHTSWRLSCSNCIQTAELKKNQERLSQQQTRVFEVSQPSTDWRLRTAMTLEQELALELQYRRRTRIENAVTVVLLLASTGIVYLIWSFISSIVKAMR